MSEDARVIPLIEEAVLAARVRQMGAELAAQCRDLDELITVALMRGAFMFVADLSRAISGHGVRQVLEFLTLESYGAGTTSSGVVTLKHGIERDLRGRPVLLVDDILDTGHTLLFARRYLEDRGAGRIITAVLLDKPSRREIPIEADHVGFCVADHFVVGYGVDLDGHYRDLPYVGVLADACHDQPAYSVGADSLPSTRPRASDTGR